MEQVYAFAGECLAAHTAEAFASVPLFRGIVDAPGVTLAEHISSSEQLLDSLSGCLKNCFDLQTPRSGE